MNALLGISWNPWRLFVCLFAIGGTLDCGGGEGFKSLDFAGEQCEGDFEGDSRWQTYNSELG